MCVEIVVMSVKYPLEPKVAASQLASPPCTGRLQALHVIFTPWWNTCSLFPMMSCTLRANVLPIAPISNGRKLPIFDDDDDDILTDFSLYWSDPIFTKSAFIYHTIKEREKNRLQRHNMSSTDAKGLMQPLVRFNDILMIMNGWNVTDQHMRWIPGH